MISLDLRIEAIIHFGEAIQKVCSDHKSMSQPEFDNVLINARVENPWFTEKNILTALENWAVALQREKIEKWIAAYRSELDKNQGNKIVAVINAGNIPFVGLHDLLSVILCGFNYTGKNATGDTVLLPHLTSLLCSVEPRLNANIRFVSKLEKMDVVIATGNNNSARYFEYYFGKYPNIIRKNRNGVGVLSGNESQEQLHSLGLDIFNYFGLGCRNVSKIYVPAGYDFKLFFESIEEFNELSHHNKYMNNFEYNNSVLLLKKIRYLQNGFLIVRNENHITSPISILHYEEYESKNELIKNLEKNFEQLQCISTCEDLISDNLEKIRVDFGKTQSPELWEYADGVDTIKFLCSIF